ncbi:LamG-like jellyroll fold domain-containing protein [Kitasatospora sp. NPDC059599]|uniref:LamG-like jellyroll fold domain-containing protein n=1 Tax=Kitasatospora sp. NPDC059599 TaxID=3346880 RepID=UPI00367D4E34
MSTLSAVRMARHLTAPFGRGADSLALRLLPGADTGSAPIAPYDFADHRATYGHPADPAYVLTLLTGCDQDTSVVLTVDQPGSSFRPAVVIVPAGTRAGTSYVVPLPSGATGAARLTTLTANPPPPGVTAAGRWALTALLGTTAKLLWAIGAERDQLRHHLERTVAQRHLETATGASLDLIGSDLGVPRFPPLPYGFDPATVAMYHLDEDPRTAPQAEDLTARYPGRNDHHGTITGPVLPSVGRFGQAFAFTGDGALVTALTSPDFDIPADGGATVECFVRPDPGLAAGLVLARHPDPATTRPGWVLEIGEFGRAQPGNVRFAIGDGTTAVELFADLSLPTDRFSHLAAVVDRSTGHLTLWVDGALRDRRPDGGLGAVRNTADLRIGPGHTGFRGTVDEVRLSSVARADFFPALGEGNEHYRNRLRIFRRWTLPTPANLTRILNATVRPIGSSQDREVSDNPLVVDDANGRVVRGTRTVTVLPARLGSGERMDRDGRRRVSEADTVGTAADELRFDPVYLLTHDDPGVDYRVPGPRVLGPGEPPPDPHRVQLVLTAPLDRLVALAAAEGAGGRLRVESAFDPRADDLRATGRAVLLTHGTVATDRLAALAHRAGFDYVEHRADVEQVYAACAVGEYLALDAAPPGNGPADLVVGASTGVRLTVRPALPVGALADWLTIPIGPGRATLSNVSATGASLTAAAPGDITVKVEVTRGSHTVSATRTLRAAPADLADGARIAADGTLDAPVTVVGSPDPDFDPVFLHRHDDARAAYGTDPDHHLMQFAVAGRLDALLDELQRRDVAGPVTVAAAHDPAGTDPLARQGRALTIRTTGLDAGQLAVVAHLVGFGHVQRSGTDVILHHPAEPLVALTGPDTVTEGSTLDLTILPPPSVVGAVGQLSLATGAFADGRAALNGATDESTPSLTGEQAGPVWVQAAYLMDVGSEPESARVPPYTFKVRLRPELVAAGQVVPKDKYDLIMNILNTLHPVGVEVLTGALREHVVESRDAATANPDYTYPKFRVGAVPPRRTKEASP